MRIKSKVEYKVGYVIQDDSSKEIFEVLKCHKEGAGFILEVKEVIENKTKDTFKDLVNCLESVKMHDKDLFMLLNIVSVLEDAVNETN